MVLPATHETSHGIDVDAPADEVYRLIADVGSWPSLFPPTIHVEHVEREPLSERIRIWATANGEVKSWVSRRAFDPAARRIDFRQEVSAAPVAAMGGAWIVEPVSPTASRVTLLHDFRAVGDDPANVDWIERAIDRNSHSELAALKANVETAAAGELGFSFSDSVTVDGSVKDAYEFIHDAGAWTERLPHVARVELTSPSVDVQTLEMDTRAKDGSTHTTKSIRVCFPGERIVYKQITLPALMTLHTGYWLFENGGAQARVTSQHTVVINPANIAKVLGPQAGIADARDYVRGALSANSMATLGLAKAFAESRR
jgi:aromatase